MRALPVVLLLALLLLGGIGWLVLGSDESGEAQIATLEPEVAEPEEVFVPADMSAPREDTREEVKVPEEAQAKALPDVQSEPDALLKPPVVGSMRVVVEFDGGEPAADIHVNASSVARLSQYSPLYSADRGTNELGVALFEALPIGEYEFTLRRGHVGPRRTHDEEFQFDDSALIENFRSASQRFYFHENNFARALQALNPGMERSHCLNAVVRERADDELYFVLPNGHALTGVVTDREVPVSNAIVRVFIDSNGALTAEGSEESNVVIFDHPVAPGARTDAEGKFRIDNLTVGSYTLSVERPTGGMWQNWEIDLPDGGASVHLELDSLAVVGIVTTTDGIPLPDVELVVERLRLDKDGRPEAREDVALEGSLYQAGCTEVIRSGPDGSYRIEGVDGSSPLVVRARAPWKITTRSRPFGFKQGELERKIDLQLPATGVITARLISSQNSAWDFSIVATPEGQDAPRFTSDYGNEYREVELHGLEPGRYRFEVTAPSMSASILMTLPDPIVAEVVAGENTLLLFEER